MKPDFFHTKQVIHICLFCLFLCVKNIKTGDVILILRCLYMITDVLKYMNKMHFSVIKMIRAMQTNKI